MARMHGAGGFAGFFFWCFLVCSATLPFIAHAGEMSIHMVDVGQGDAMVLHQPAACTMLIDTGLPVHAERVKELLEKLNATGIDTLIITHPHLDHFGGIFEILSTFPAALLYDNGADGEPSSAFEEYRKLRTSIAYRPLVSGNTLQCGDISIKVLHPESFPANAANLNDTSLVMLISYADFRLLHMGDLAGDAAAAFAAGQSDLQADLIKIAHHGYGDAASDALLDMVDPAYAVISTSGKSCVGNSCSPAQTVLDRLEAHGVAWFRTDRDGEIKIQVKKQDSYRISISKSR
jgi:beta-lactamase superfamily II metal-dependent hydrolase